MILYDNNDRYIFLFSFHFNMKFCASKKSRDNRLNLLAFLVYI
nr:MAG TPA: hypothetical protein [Bacteriophage sp.]